MFAGRLFAVLSSCETIVPIFSSVTYTQLYKATEVSFTSAVYLLSASILAVPMLTFLWIFIDERKINKANKERLEKEGIINPTSSIIA